MTPSRMRSLFCLLIGAEALRAPTRTLRRPSLLQATQLEQLADVTVLSIDTGDLDIIEQYAKGGLISDATTNPLFVAQAGTSGDARYVAFVDKAIAYAKANSGGDDVVSLAMDRLAVELGLEIVKLVPGYVSTEVDIRASFDTEESVRRARRIIAMYEAEGVDRCGNQILRRVRAESSRRPRRDRWRAHPTHWLIPHRRRPI